MNVKRVATLFIREVRQEFRSFIVIFALIVPVLLSLILSLAFGTLFSGKARLGIVDQSSSELTRRAREVSSLIVKEYETEEDLVDAAGRGAVDVGLVLPSGFDRSLKADQETDMQVYVWGESLIKHRAVIVATLSRLLRGIVGQPSPVKVVTATVGEASSIPWQTRLLPLIVLVAVFMSGFFIPATSLVNERQKRTLTAVSTTPATLGDVFAAKGLFGLLLSMITGSVILLLNNAFGTRPALLLLVLALGAVMASVLGLILGVMSKDINTLFATVKSSGIFLYAPAILFLFPDIPRWIGYIFPTYYVVAPIVEISQEGAGLAGVWVELAILLAIIALLAIILSLLTNRMKLKEL